MRSTLRFMLGATVLMTAAAYAADGVTRIFDRGRDGDIYYYEVLCDNGSRGSILVEDSEPLQTCAMSGTLARQCDSNWSLREAAKRVCN